MHFSLGLILASEKQYKAAELELEKADALQPGTFEILYNLGQTFLRDGDYSKAELALARALKLKPDSPERSIISAQVYADESRPLDALDLLVRAHKIAPENTDIIYLMAQVSISQNYFEDAIPLLEVWPCRSLRSGRICLPHWARAISCRARSTRPIEVFKKLIEVEPSARSYAFVGLSYRNLGRFDEAKQYFRKDSSWIRTTVPACSIWVSSRSAREIPRRAEAMFQQVLQLNPDYSDALLELANLRIAEETTRRLQNYSGDTFV